MCRAPVSMPSRRLFNSGIIFELGGNLHARVDHVAFAARLGAAQAVAFSVMRETCAHARGDIQPAADGLGHVNLMQGVGPKQAVVFTGAGVVVAALSSPRWIRCRKMGCRPVDVACR